MNRMIIDAHQHFWDPGKGDYPWMSGEAASLKRIYSPADLRSELEATGVAATILVQTWSSVEETVEFMETAATTDFVTGVVGWVDLTAPDVERTIAGLKSHRHGRYLVEIRHQVHDEPDVDWLLRKDVRRGLEAVAAHDLVYDLLLRPAHIPAALAVARELPHLRLVVDHIAKPEIAADGFAAWSRSMAAFSAERSHVWCKLSGMVTEADWQNWTVEQLVPYIREALEVFGPDRCLFGSDWPVCTLAASFTQVLSCVCAGISHLSEAEKSRVLAGSAVDLYRLDETLPVLAGRGA